MFDLKNHKPQKQKISDLGPEIFAFGPRSGGGATIALGHKQ
jgi:hypothetical protein